MGIRKYIKRTAAIAMAASMIQTALPQGYQALRTVFAEEAALEEQTPALVISQPENEIGNVFFDNEEMSVRALFDNQTDNILNLDIEYKIVNYSGEELFSGNLESITLAEKEQNVQQIDIPELPYDTYKILIEASDEGGGFAQSGKIEFSRVREVADSESDSPFGVCVHFTQNKGGDPNINLGTIERVGAKWVREDFSWGGIETEKGKYTFDRYDSIVDKMAAHDRNILAILTYGCKFYDDGNAPYTEEGIAAFAAYCGATAEHYKGKIDHFEIWNEYNGGMGNPLRQPPEVYAQMLKAAYTAIKEANPDATVVGCSTSVVDIGWIERVLKAVGPDYMDAVSVHPYGFPASPESAGLETNIKNVHELLKQYGKDMPVWSSEYGYPTYMEGVSEDLGAAYLARAYIILNSISPDDKVFWYDFQNDTPASDTDREANFGLIKHETDNYAAKQTLLSHANIINQLLGRTYKETLKPNDNVIIYKYEGEEDMLALWALEKEENISVKIGAPTVKVTDFLGNEECGFDNDVLQN